MSKDRFGFGKNWSEFLKILGDEKISIAKQSLTGKVFWISAQVVDFLV